MSNILEFVTKDNEAKLIEHQTMIDQLQKRLVTELQMLIDSQPFVTDFTIQPIAIEERVACCNMVYKDVVNIDNMQFIIILEFRRSENSTYINIYVNNNKVNEQCLGYSVTIITEKDYKRIGAMILTTIDNITHSRRECIERYNNILAQKHYTLNLTAPHFKFDQYLTAEELENFDRYVKTLKAVYDQEQLINRENYEYVNACRDTYHGVMQKQEMEAYLKWRNVLQEKYFKPFNVKLVEFVPEGTITIEGDDEGNEISISQTDVCVDGPDVEGYYTRFNTGLRTLTRKKYFNVISVEIIPVNQCGERYCVKVNVNKYFKSKHEYAHLQPAYIYVDPLHFQEIEAELEANPPICDGVIPSFEDYMQSQGCVERDGNWFKATTC